MKIYRVYEINSHAKTELAFFSSAKSAVEYIKSNLPTKNILGYSKKKNDWCYKIDKMKKTLLDGYRWGEEYGGYVIKSYGIDVINIEK
jgi:hypothetical protein